MTEIKVSKQAIQKGITCLHPCESYRIIIGQPARKVLELEDVHFHHNSGVLLPGKLDAPSDAAAKGLCGMDVLAGCLKHAQTYPDDLLLIAGHTDTTGADAYNNKHSLLRSRVVHAVLTGDRDQWCTLVDEKDKVEDRQFILKWFAVHRVRKEGPLAGAAWNCDPGSIDNADGPQTQTALKKFQNCYNLDFSCSIKEDGKIGPETWGAIFDVYMDELKKSLAVDEAGLASLRAGLHFASDTTPCTGCGESHPIEQSARDNYRSQTNRRVELLFMNAEDVPVLPCGAEGGCPDPASCPIYTEGWELIYIDIEGEPAFCDLVIEWSEVLSDKLPSDLHLYATAADTAFDLAWSAGEVRDDVRRFVFERLRCNTLCTLQAVSGSTRLVLWREQDIVDSEKPPTWEHLIEDFMQEEGDELSDVPAGGNEEDTSIDGVPSFN